MALYSKAQIRKVLAVAVKAVEARQAGKKTIVLGNITFHNKSGNYRISVHADLDDPGWCNRLIRQCFEVGLGLPPFNWYFGAATAHLTLMKLAPYQLAAGSKPQSGDIIGFSGDPGHIVLALGDWYGDGRFLVAENTSAKRGDPSAPGTKVTALKNLRTQGRSVYRLWA